MFTALDLLLPKVCVGCKGEGSWLCEECFAPLFVSQALSCADCKRLTSDGRYCRFHAKDHVLRGLIMVGPFISGTLREAIHTMKYNGVTELSVPLGKVLARRIVSYPQLASAVIIPIPLHPTRLAQRGFNQAELIAKQIPNYSEASLLIRYRATAPQAKLSHEVRKTNVLGAFGVRKAAVSTIVNKTVILIDDVATTGTTLDSAAAVLKKAGARSVWGAVLAKG